MSYARRAVLMLGALLLGERVAGADPADGANNVLALEWVAPAECPSREDVVQDVARLLGPSSNEALTAHVSVSVGADGRWHGTIRTMGASGGERTLDAPSCKALAKATALVFALRINPKLLSDGPREAPTPPSPPLPSPPAPTPPPPPPPPPSLAPPVPHTTRHAPAWSVGALVLGTVKELPFADATGGLVVAYTPPQLQGRARLELHGAAGGSHQVAGQPVGVGDVFESVRGSAKVAGAGLRGCYGPVWGAFAALGCAGIEADWLQVVGEGGMSASTQSAAWSTIEIGGQLRWALVRWLALRLDLSALVPLAPPEFVVRSSDDAIVSVVSQPGHVWGRLGFGVEALLF